MFVPYADTRGYICLIQAIKSQSNHVSTELIFSGNQTSRRRKKTLSLAQVQLNFRHFFNSAQKLLSNKEFVLPLKREAMFLRGYQINITVYCTKEALVGVGIGATISDMTRITSDKSLIGGILRCHLTTHIKRFECVQIQDLHITLYLTVLREKTK